MGFFSWLCKGCNKPILNPYSVTTTNKWMNQVVVPLKSGAVIGGSYDGYGRVYANGSETDLYLYGQDLELWHHSCWRKSGRPEYTGPSASDPKQGHFVGNEYDNEKEPKWKTKPKKKSASKPKTKKPRARAAKRP